ncbi:MAG: hypothetical protein V3W50_03575 [Thermoanaerobaculia bacterium]
MVGTGDHTHPEIQRFQRELSRDGVPDGVEFQFEDQVIRGERRNTDWSKLGLTVGALFALAISSAGMVWIPVFNLAWAAAILVLLLAAPYFVARAAVFRYRKGRKKTFSIDFSGASPRWRSNADNFWQPIRDFFKV